MRSAQFTVHAMAAAQKAYQLMLTFASRHLCTTHTMHCYHRRYTALLDNTADVVQMALEAPCTQKWVPLTECGHAGHRGQQLLWMRFWGSRGQGSHRVTMAKFCSSSFEGRGDLIMST